MTLKVLHLLNELRMSGAEIQLLRSREVWRAAGVDPDIVTTGRDQGELAPSLVRAGYRVHHLPYSARLSFLTGLRDILREGGYDVLHLHSERAYFWQAMAARSVRGVRVVRSIRSTFPYRGVRRLERIGQRALLRTLGVPMASVGGGVERYEREYFHNPTPIIRNWIDASRFRPAGPEERDAARRLFGLDRCDRVLSSVGNCATAKNHEAVLSALVDLPGWRYLHAGSEGAGADERQLARELGVADRVQFLGAVEDVTTVLHASDVFAMPSRYEGLGNAAIEALAAGVPAVLGDCPGLGDLRDVVDLGVRWVDPAGDRLADEVEQLARRPLDDHERQALHRAIADRYGMERGVRAYLQLYAGARATGQGRVG